MVATLCAVVQAGALAITGKRHARGHRSGLRRSTWRLPFAMTVGVDYLPGGLHLVDGVALLRA